MLVYHLKVHHVRFVACLDALKSTQARLCLFLASRFRFPLHFVSDFSCATLFDRIMKGGAQFRGVAQGQDAKFGDKHAKLRKTMSFPAKFEHRVERSKFKMEPLRPWITEHVTELLGMEDDIVTEYAYTLIEGNEDSEDRIDAKDLQINLQGFLGAVHAKTFVSELWDLIMDAEKRSDGIPLQIAQGIEIDRVLAEEKSRGQKNDRQTKRIKSERD